LALSRAYHSDRVGCPCFRLSIFEGNGIQKKRLPLGCFEAERMSVERRWRREGGIHTARQLQVARAE
jgi:hypothetical protein